MVRIQVQLTEDQAEHVRDVANTRGVSMSAVIREAVERLRRDPGRPSREALKRRALEVVGKYSSGCSDVAESHDTYLAEIYAQRDE